MRNNGHYAVQGHLKSPISVPIEVNMDLCVHNTHTDLQPILHRFQDMVDYWSNFWRRQGMPLFHALVLAELIHSGIRIAKFGLKKLETMVQSIFQHLEP